MKSHVCLLVLTLVALCAISTSAFSLRSLFLRQNAVTKETVASQDQDATKTGNTENLKEKEPNPNPGDLYRIPEYSMWNEDDYRMNPTDPQIDKLAIYHMLPEDRKKYLPSSSSSTGVAGPNGKGKKKKDKQIKGDPAHAGAGAFPNPHSAFDKLIHQAKQTLSVLPPIPKKALPKPPKKGKKKGKKGKKNKKGKKAKKAEKKAKKAEKKEQAEGEKKEKKEA